MGMEMFLFSRLWRHNAGGIACVNVELRPLLWRGGCLGEPMSGERKISRYPVSNK
jgi:hypothetical protein